MQVDFYEVLSQGESFPVLNRLYSGLITDLGSINIAVYWLKA